MGSINPLHLSQGAVQNVSEAWCRLCMQWKVRDVDGVCRQSRKLPHQANVLASQ